MRDLRARFPDALDPVGATHSSPKGFKFQTASSKSVQKVVL
jgi:hypothetical protein